ncbi:ribokinase [Bacillus tianshenii]|nr:ribokinase [Bacillus tianshenii]
MKKPNITVIGSINMDLVTTAEIVPEQGETLMGTSFDTNPGGKGANQAVASAKLGANVTFIGCVGDDPFGQELIMNMKNHGIQTDRIKTITDEATGIATIILSNGDNRIIVVPGANKFVSPELVEENEDIIAESDIVLLQLEIPMVTVETAAALAKKHNTKVILNPAPIQSLSNELLESVEHLTPNEHEVKELFEQAEHEEQKALFKQLESKFIITKGSKGVSYCHDNIVKEIDSFDVEAVDTTGAGDSFNGAIAVALSEGMELERACGFANAVGALSVTKSGAQGGMPTREEVERFLHSRKGV